MNYTQMRLAILAGVSLPTIQNLEAGKANPTVTLLQKVFKALGLKWNISHISPNWDLLQKFALPLAETSQHRKLPIPSPKKFAAELQCAVDNLSAGKGKHDKRLEESVVALLWGIKRHFPTFYEYCLDNKNTGSLLKRNYPPGKIIKLSRIALEKISHII